MHDTLHSAISAYNESNHFINLLRYDGKCSELVMYCIWMSASERNDHESIVFIFYICWYPITGILISTAGTLAKVADI